MRLDVYAVGGFDPLHPSGNRVESWNGVDGTYTRWNHSGQPVERRPLTADEAERFSRDEITPVASQEDRLAALEAALVAVAKGTGTDTLPEVAAVDAIAVTLDLAAIEDIPAKG